MTAGVHVPLLVVGALAVLLGGAGAVGILDRSGFRLYQAPRAASSPSRHRLLQRLGGAALVVVGVVLVVVALRR